MKKIRVWIRRQWRVLVWVLRDRSYTLHEEMECLVCGHIVQQTNVIPSYYDMEDGEVLLGVCSACQDEGICDFINREG